MMRTGKLVWGFVMCIGLSGMAAAQDFGGGPGPGGDGPGGGPPPMVRTFHGRGFGRWWNNPQIAQSLNLTDEQKRQMDQTLLQHRLQLIDLNANLEKKQMLLGPLMEADQPDETKILAQIDAIAQARADLEKANARMLFDLRKTLTADQWKKLKALRTADRDRDGGPGAWRRDRPQSRDGFKPGSGEAPPPPPPPPPSGEAPPPPPQ